MKKVSRRRMDDSSSSNVWRSYSDIMSGLLLLFVLIMAVCLMQAQKNYTEKLAEQAKLLQSQNELELSQSQLEASQTQLGEQQAKLDEQESELAKQELTLAEQAATLEELQRVLEAQQASLAEKESEVEEKNTLLQQQESELVSSQAKLDEANALMASQQARIDQIIGVKAELIEALNEEFKTNQMNVQIDKETGAMVLDSSVLFAFNESNLTDEGTMILDEVLPVYCKVLLSSEYVDYIAEIIVDGYTDSTGDYITNLSLSQNRAYAVAGYLYSIMEQFLTEQERTILLSKMTANGKSSSNPILTADGQEDMDASRRVEIKFRLRDEEMISELQELIEATQQSEEAAIG